MSHLDTAIISREEMLHRQRNLGITIPAEVTIVGVGGTGSWVALVLAMAGVKELHLFDSDSVEGHNLNRLPVPVWAVGTKKVGAVALVIEHLRPDVMVVANAMRWTQGLESLLQGVVFDCTDRVEVQKDLFDSCQRLGLQYIRSGCDANNMTASSMLPWNLAPAGGYGEEVPIWASPAIIAAAYAVGHAFAGWKQYSGGIDRREGNGS